MAPNTASSTAHDDSVHETRGQDNNNDETPTHSRQVEQSVLPDQSFPTVSSNGRATTTTKDPPTFNLTKKRNHDVVVSSTDPQAANQSFQGMNNTSKKRNLGASVGNSSADELDHDDEKLKEQEEKAQIDLAKKRWQEGDEHSAHGKYNDAISKYQEVLLVQGL
mmetsp:Transcript_38761/g.93695  ORF Transcript_38761/g.93695 Transcript_38761/m.93695 type:complete len:164 (+) Transcript_38761:219-710(+)